MGGRAGKERAVEERDREEGKKKYNKHSTALSHDFIKNWVSSKPGQDLLPQGEKKKKRQAPSVYFLGWKPEQIQQIFTQGPSHV